MQRAMRAVPCLICGSSFNIPKIEYTRSAEKRFICSPACGKPRETRECILCGRYFKTYAGSLQVVCSHKCSRMTCRTYKPMKLEGKYSPRRRAIMRDGDEIDRVVLLTMYNGKCCICSQEINLGLKYPHPMCYTYEHIVPLCMLPVHSWETVAPAHLRCNSEKGSKYAENYSTVR